MPSVEGSQFSQPYTTPPGSSRVYEQQNAEAAQSAAAEQQRIQAEAQATAQSSSQSQGTPVNENTGRVDIYA